MKKYLKALVVGAGMLSAIVPTVAKSSSETVIVRQIKNDINSHLKGKQVLQIGGIPLIQGRYYTNPGLSPKEYGMRFGTGASRKGKVNKKHRSRMLRLNHKSA